MNRGHGGDLSVFLHLPLAGSPEQHCLPGLSGWILAPLSFSSRTTPLISFLFSLISLSVVSSSRAPASLSAGCSVCGTLQLPVTNRSPQTGSLSIQANCMLLSGSARNETRYPSNYLEYKLSTLPASPTLPQEIDFQSCVFTTAKELQSNKMETKSSSVNKIGIARDLQQKHFFYRVVREC